MNTQEKSCIVLLSGGQDSTTALYWAKQNFEKVYTVSFYYGQKHMKEIHYAQRNSKAAGAVEHKLLNVESLLGKSSLTEDTDHNSSHSLDSSLPASFTAGRNLLFLTAAAAVATDYGITDLVAGVCQTDYSGYPDCRRTTIDALQLSLSLGLGAGDIRIHTPLMYLTKAETFKLAKDLGVLDVIITETLTDYNGDETLNEWGRGNLDNPASLLRAAGYEEAKRLNYI